MNYRRLFVGIVLLGTLLVYRPVAIQAAASQEQLDAIGTRVETCVSLQSSACFSVNPTLPYTYIAVYNDWVNQLRVGRIPAQLNDYVALYYNAGQELAGQVSSTLSDLNSWKTAHEANLGTTGGGTAPGGIGTTPGGVVTGGTTTGGTGTTPGGVLISGAKQKPGDFAVKALDTSNFLQDSVSYGWVTDVWQAMRQMSNILIVVFLFLGALATTLNYNLNTYGIKRVLPSVVQAAILANFSYIVMNAAIEAIGLTQKGLLGLGVGGASVNQSTWSTLAAPLGDILTGVQPGSGTGFADIMWGLIVALAVGVAMLMLWLVVGILYIRSFVIAMLVCFAPLAILSMALPATQGLWKKWWDEFLKWLLLPLVVCFWLMVASLVAGVAVLPAFLKMAVVMFAVFQGVKAPFSFKPAIAGAALGYGLAQLTNAGRGVTNLGKDVGTRALYANNVTGGAMRGWDRWSQKKAASMSVLKDTSSVIRTPRAPKEDAGWAQKAYWTATLGGVRERFGRNANAFFEKHDLGVERGKAAVASQKSAAEVTSAEANKGLLQDIAALNTSQEALSNAMESLKTGAKAAALAGSESLKTEKKLAEFRKNEAANLMKQIESDMGSDAITEGSPLSNAIKTRLAGDDALRRTFQAYGVQVNDDGSGFVEGTMQNQVNATAAAEAFESTAKRNQLNVARRDYGRHDMVNSIKAQIGAADIPTLFTTGEERMAVAQHIQTKLKPVLRDEEMAQYGIDDAAALAGDDAKLAEAVNLYNGQATTPISAEMVGRLSSGKRNRGAAAIRQLKMVSEDIATGASTLSEISRPMDRDDRLQKEIDTIVKSAGLGNTVDATQVNRALASKSREGSLISDSGQRITGSAHYAVIAAAKKNLKSLRTDSVQGSGGTPDINAIPILLNRLVAMGATPAGGSGLDNAHNDIDAARAGLVGATTNDQREAAIKVLKSAVINNDWLNDL